MLFVVVELLLLVVVVDVFVLVVVVEFLLLVVAVDVGVLVVVVELLPLVRRCRCVGAGCCRRHAATSGRCRCECA